MTDKLGYIVNLLEKMKCDQVLASRQLSPESTPDHYYFTTTIDKHLALRKSMNGDWELFGDEHEIVYKL